MNLGPGVHRFPCRFFLATCGLVIYDTELIGRSGRSFSGDSRNFLVAAALVQKN